ncbi:MAG: hypothetical protein EOO98_01505 [Pedobacter sp.]|nr:MAG: hypothetical protein EOO98_01505 [Pedobacter sp.]
MKNAYLLLIPILFVYGSCKKGKLPDENLPDENNITACANGASCNFFYAENAGMDGNKLLLTTGQYRVFWAKTSIDYSAFSLYMMAPMIGDKFTLTKEDMLAGKVKYQNNCALCYANSIFPVDGKITGRRLKPANGLPERWLIEADVTPQVSGTSIPTPTIHLKQYYLPAN